MVHLDGRINILVIHIWPPNICSDFSETNEKAVGGHMRVEKSPEDFNELLFLKGIVSS